MLAALLEALASEFSDELGHPMVTVAEVVIDQQGDIVKLKPLVGKAEASAPNAEPPTYHCTKCAHPLNTTYYWISFTPFLPGMLSWDVYLCSKCFARFQRRVRQRFAALRRQLAKTETPPL